MSITESYQHELIFNAPYTVAQGHNCLSTQQLLQCGDDARNRSAARYTTHVETCPHCAARQVVLQAGDALSRLPARWNVHLGSAFRAWPTDPAAPTFQVLGHISFDSAEFRICHEEDWISSPLAMRVNVVVDDDVSLFSVTVLDAPLCIERISIVTSKGLQPLHKDCARASFNFVLCVGGDAANDDVCVTFAEMHDLLAAHKLQMVVEMSSAHHEIPRSSEANYIVDVLEQHQAIERCADYVLPNGLHSDTYINASAMCSREESMQLIAVKMDFLFWDTHFDTVLANGWAMSLIGRRLAATRQAQGRKVPIRQVLCEGYAEPVLLDDIIPGSQVLIVLDVVVSGHLATTLRRLVQATGSNVVGIGAMVRPHGKLPSTSIEIRALGEVEMNLVDARKTTCPRCGVLPQQVFNPIAGCMTTKCTAPRSPSQFLSGDANARELWEDVRSTGAYEHHRREGDTHYIGFVDTRKLLGDRRIGQKLVQRLVEIVCQSGTLPRVLLLPRRSRARLLANKMARALEKLTGVRPRAVEASRQFLTREWDVAPIERAILVDADVLIVDTAAGHGRTIDQLATLAGKAKARRVGAAVLLSRLTPPCEDAFNLRLTGGYHRLFSLPIRPVAIRGDRIDLCPVCRRRNAIRRFAEGSDVEALEKWADSLLTARRGPSGEHRQRSHRQLTLFERDDPFLSNCGAAVASGITLHALGAATTNGSAPLSLPELSDERIPWRARATMVENLPAGVLEWTGPTLVADLMKVLSDGDYPSIWKAAANLLSREGSDMWLDHLEPMLDRLADQKMSTSPSFWNHMACNAFLLASRGTERRHDVQARIKTLLSRQEDDVVQNGLRQMHDLIRD